MNGVSAYVTFLRRRSEDWYSKVKTLEETVDSSFHFEGRGDGVFVTFAKKGYAPGYLHLDRDNSSSGKLIGRDIRVVMKELTQEKQAELVFSGIRDRIYNDNIVRHKGEKWPTTEEQLERLRKDFGLEKSDMTDIFVKAIRDYLSGKETNSENQTLQDRRHFADAIYHLEYYPPPQQQFLELTRKTVELETESDRKHIVDTLVTAYKKTYPDAEPPDAK